MIHQQTVSRSASIQGIGLHSGQDISLSLSPAAAGSGIVFIRSDVEKAHSIIHAAWDNVVDTQLCTVIGNEHGVRVGTIEHLMAALRGCGIDNVIVTLNGPEVPVMDGSALPFVHMIETAGVKEQGVPRRVIKILKNVSFEHEGKRVQLSQARQSVFGGAIKFDHPDIGEQSYEVQILNGNFLHDIAEARTFGFLHEVEYLRSKGLARGGSLENAIVLDESKVMNPEGLRFHDEFIRHKILDAIGDLYLAGAQIIGAYDGYKAGHMMNNAILHELFKHDDAWCYVELDTDNAAFSTAGKNSVYAAA